MPPERGKTLSAITKPRIEEMNDKDGSLKNAGYRVVPERQSYTITQEREIPLGGSQEESTWIN